MCAQPVTGSIASWMKSSRWRLLTRGTQAMPRLQMSPMCIGVLPVMLLTFHVALPGGKVRLDDWAPYNVHLQASGYVGALAAALSPAQPPGSALPSGPVGRIVGGRRQGTSTWPGGSAAMAGDQRLPRADG